ncbi:MAG: TIGR02099 family protein [Methylomicrobium sp.]|nr:TIGR02099 family protein [Methylomicrobium sp.]
MIHHLTRATRHLIFWSLLTAALGLTGIRILMTGVERYKAVLEKEVSALIDTPVRIGKLSAGMHHFTAIVKLQEIDIPSYNNSPKAAIKLDEIRLSVNLWDLALTRQLWSSSWVTLVGAELTAKRKADGSFAIAGLKAGAGDEKPLWLLQGSKLELLHSRITWQNEQLKAKPVLFDQVDLVIKNDTDDDRHTLHMLLELPEKLGRSLRLSMVLEGNLFEPGQMSGQVFLEGHDVQLAQFLTGEMPAELLVNAGLADFRVWMNWHQSQLKQIQGEGVVKKLAVKTQTSKTPLALEKLETRFRWRQQSPERWQLDVNDLLIETRESIWPPGQFSLAVQNDSQGAAGRVSLAVKKMDLEPLSMLLKLIPQAEAGDAELPSMNGQLLDFKLAADISTQAFTVDGKFRNLGLAEKSPLPGLQGLSGYVKGNSNKGQLTLDAENLDFSASELFRNHLAFQRFKGRIFWRQTNDNWKISTADLALDSQPIKTLSRVKLTIPKNGDSPFLDLHGDFSIADARAASHYYPVGIMNPGALAWLDHAFVAGQVPRGGLLIHGKLEDYPFNKGQGVFQVLFDVADGELEYSADWPHLTKLDAQVEFLGEGLTVDIHSAQSLACKVNEALVTIPSLETSPHVLIKGKAQGEMAGIMAYLKATPLKSTANSLLAAITPKGSSQVNLDLKIPLDDVAPLSVNGDASLENASLRVHAFDLPVTQIKGALRFDQVGVYGKGITASTLGSPIKLDIDTKPEQTDIFVNGHAGIEALRKQFEMPFWAIAEGSSDYRLQLRLPSAQNKPPELIITTDLIGMNIDLPENMAKSKQQKKNLVLNFDLGDEQFLPIGLTYDNTLKAALKIDVQQKQLYAGHFLIGQGVAVAPEEKRVRFEVNSERLNVKGWLNSGPVKGGVSPDFIDEFEVHTQHLISNQNDLGAVYLKLKRTESHWLGSVTAAVAKGEFKMPLDLSGNDKITLDMDFIDLHGINQFQLDGGQAQANPVLPLFDINSKKILWNTVDLGQLTLTSKRTEEGIYFNKVELTSQRHELSLTGSWKVKDNQAQTQVKGFLKSEKFGPLLRKLGLYKDMRGGKVFDDFALNWVGGPHQFNLAGINGYVDVKWRDGRLLSIEPGLGRVLGILAFSQWAKRLQLDFRDVYKEGLMFNSIKGRINLNRGIADTHNLVIDAVPAKITITGKTSLIDKTLDQLVSVVPKSSDAVPIAGTILGRVTGLIAGAMTNDFQDGFFFRSEYQLKGTWQNPEIIPTHENDGLFQKTWKGITGFPWVTDEEEP